MKTSIWTTRLFAPWMVAAALAVPASADSVAVMIQNNSSEHWTLKHGDIGDVTLDLTLDPDGKSSAFQMKNGVPKPGYYDLAPGKTYILYLSGKTGRTKIDCKIMVGGPNGNFKIIHIFRELPASRFVSSFEVDIEGEGYVTEPQPSGTLGPAPKPDREVRANKYGILIMDDKPVPGPAGPAAPHP